MRLLLFIFFCLSANALFGQVPPSEPLDSTSKVIVDFANLFEYIQENGNVYQRLLGDVELRQDSVFLYCDSALIKNEVDVDAIGNVIIQQSDSVTIFSDSANFNSINRFAKLFGDVVLLNDNQKLFTDSLQYNLNTKVATYNSGATLTNDTSQLTSQIGYYYVDQSVIYFKNDVVVVNPEFSLKADTLKFNTNTRIATFLGPTLISTKENGKIYCEGGFYDIRNQRAEFTQNAQYAKDDSEAKADTIRYDGKTGTYTLSGNADFIDQNRSATADIIVYDERTDQTFLQGNATYKDGEQDVVADEIFYDAKNKTYKTSGRSVINDGPQIIQADQFDFDDTRGVGVAIGNVIWRDTVQNFVLYAEAADYDKENDYMKTRGGRPMMIAIVEGDSLFLKADTLIAQRQTPDTVLVERDTALFATDTTIITQDTGRLVLAYNNVKIYKSDLQAVADSMAYDVADSLFQFFRDPIIWSDTTQFTADSIDMTMANGQLDKILLKQKGLIINSPDELYFNQIKGKYITASFEEKELRRMLVEGNAESIYYAIDDVEAYVGVNKTVCSEMLLYFGNNQIDKIKFFPNSQAKLTPMQQANHGEMKLEGFRWIKDVRPLSKEDL